MPDVFIRVWLSTSTIGLGCWKTHFDILKTPQVSKFRLWGGYPNSTMVRDIGIRLMGFYSQGVKPIFKTDSRTIQHDWTHNAKIYMVFCEFWDFPLINHFNSGSIINKNGTLKGRVD